MGAEFELREQDRWLPIANVARLMKSTLPGTAKVSKDAKECMQECVSEFISFVTSEASDRCLMDKRKTVNGEDILYSMHTLGFENYAEVLKIYLAKYRQQQAVKQERGELKKKRKAAAVIEAAGYVVQDKGDFEYAIDEETMNKHHMKEEENSNFDYVEQLYEQSYGNEALSIDTSNPDYRGNGASTGIIHKTENSQQIQASDSNSMPLEMPENKGREEIEAETNTNDRQFVYLEEDLHKALGVDVHVGNRETLEMINSRMNNNEGARGGSSQIQIPQGTNTNDHDINSRMTVVNAAGTRTTATTAPSELLLLEENVSGVGVTETEELVGLTNGHSVLF